MSDPNPLTVVINLGLRSVRAVIFDSALNKIAQSSLLPVRTFVHGDHIEQNPLEWWELSKRALNEATAEVDKQRIEKITVTTSSCCLVPSDSSGNPITNAIMVSDKRSKEEAREIGTIPELQSLWSNPNFLPLPSFMPPKILWLSRNRLAAFQAADLFLGSNDFLVMKLCGKPVTDPLNAEKFYFSNGSGYHSKLLEIIGIKPSNLPEVREVGSTVGSIDSKLSSELGLPEQVKVVLSTYDALCAFWGSGIHGYSVAANTCGTCSSLRVASAKPVEKNSIGILSQHFGFSDVYVVGGSNNLEGGLLEWAKTCLYADYLSRGSDFVYDLMCQEASDSSPGSNGLIFLPYLLGERTPMFDPDTRGVFFGLERFHTRKNLMRSIFEGIGFLTLDMISAIEGFGVPVRELRVSGGLARNELVCQIKADFTGKPVSVIDEVETTSLGAALLANLGKADVSNLQSLARGVKVKKVFYPNNEMTKKYNELYKIWKALYSQTSDLFKQRTTLGSAGEFTVENL